MNVIQVINGAANIISFPVVVAGNALVMAAIWRNQALRTPSFILLAGLALSNLGVGLTAQPLYVFALLTESVSLLDIFKAGNIVWYFCQLSFSTITVMAIERWLFMSRRAVLTLKRTCLVYVALLLCPLPFITTFHLSNAAIPVGFALLVCSGCMLIVTPVAYYKVFQIIRLHQLQVHNNQMAQNFNQVNGNFNLNKYKKSVFTILYISASFLLTYLPLHLWWVSWFFLKDRLLDSTYLVVGHYLLTVMFMNSSLNPLLCCWRMKDIRDGVKHLLRKISCS